MYSDSTYSNADTPLYFDAKSTYRVVKLPCSDQNSKRINELVTVMVCSRVK